MTDEQNPFTPAPPPERPFARKRGGWPKGKKRLKTEPLPKAVVEAAVERAVKRPMIAQMKAKPNWDDDTAWEVGEEGADRLRIPQEIVNSLARDGIALQWITRSVRGMEMPQEVSKMTKGGWTPVHQSDFSGLLDGMFMPKGTDDVIGVDDCMLVARPMHIHQQAKKREKAQANSPINIRAAELGAGINVPGGNHPTAIAGNRINKTVERIEIPE